MDKVVGMNIQLLFHQHMVQHCRRDLICQDAMYTVCQIYGEMWNGSEEFVKSNQFKLGHCISDNYWPCNSPCNSPNLTSQFHLAEWMQHKPIYVYVTVSPPEPRVQSTM